MKELVINMLEEFTYHTRKFSDPSKVLKKTFKKRVGYELNLQNPITFNEKLQWLKLYDHNSDYTKMVDKYEVRSYVTKTIGDEYLIPLLGVYEKFEDIDFCKLPNQFVMKCTHDSGGLVICKDKDKFDIKAAKKKIEKCLKRNYYYYSMEWPYKNGKPRIVCEKYMVDESGTELKDYKIFCFNGEPKLIQVDYNRFVNHKRNLYDIDWNYIDASLQKPNDSTIEITKPPKLNEMLKLAQKLSEQCPFARVDFYSIENRLYFGEITFYPGAGYEKFYPDELDLELGKCIRLPNKSE
ncbi:ATP-grasp fold amidoligase family protein [Peribacillus frigoritolerans]|uniref:ATP-grasp fold amidoligase family protein n=1 Tax=Peribacillus castrilensis TaxID=2897690 RepID=UPI00296F46A9|nr:glycosyl transferase [Peribacillus castrilensis]